MLYQSGIFRLMPLLVSCVRGLTTGLDLSSPARAEYPRGIQMDRASQNSSDPANSDLEIINCNSQQERFLDGAWIAAQLSLLQASIAINSPTFDVFFDRNSPFHRSHVKFLVQSISRQAWSLGGVPKYICADEEIFVERYPDILASNRTAVADCLNPADSSVGHILSMLPGQRSVMFICPGGFFERYSPVPRGGAPLNCPPLKENRFQTSGKGQFNLAQSIELQIANILFYTNLDPEEYTNVWSMINKAILERRKATSLAFSSLFYSKS